MVPASIDENDLRDYIHTELLEEGYVPGEEEIDFLTEIVFDYILMTFVELGFEVQYREGEE